MKSAKFVPEYSDEDGAKALCKKLEEFWRGKGSKTFRCWPAKGLVIHDFTGSIKEVWWSVESNLVNGLPPDMLHNRKLAA